MVTFVNSILKRVLAFPTVCVVVLSICLIVSVKEFHKIVASIFEDNMYK